MAINGVASLQASKITQTQNWKTQGMIDHKHRQIPNGNTSFMQNMAAKNNTPSVVPAVSAQQGNTVPGVTTPGASTAGSVLGTLLDLSL